MRIDRMWMGVRIFVRLLRKAFRIFRGSDPLRMAGATAFFAGFALPPIMIILIEVLGLFWRPGIVARGLFTQLDRAMDPNTVMQIRDILHNVHILSLSGGMRLGGFIFLLFVATTLFDVVKNAINQLWDIRLKGHAGWLAILTYRVKSIGIIIIAGLLFLLVLLGDTTGWLLQHFVYHAVAMIAIITWFVVVLKFLSDGRPVWRVAIGGGVFTGILFALGVLLLRWLLSFNSAETIYGASTALTLLLLFVFYSAFIFYYGAAFTRALGEQLGLPIRRNHQSTLPSGEVEGRQPELGAEPDPRAAPASGSK